mgnify:CR=1 FL=1
MVSKAAVPYAAKKSARTGDCVQLEPMGQTDGFPTGRSSGDRQQPQRKVDQAICDWTKELAVCQHASRSTGQRDDL